MESATLEAIRAFDNLQCVEYMTDQLLKLGFTEYTDGAFVYDDVFKVVFYAGKNGESIMPMMVIHKFHGEKERSYPEYLKMYSIAQIRMAFTKLTGKPL